MDGNDSIQSVTITKDNFEKEVIQSELPVLVDFWAAWCGPCRVIASIVEELAAKYAGQLKVGKLNVDENRALATRFSVRSIPTLMLFRDGSVQDVIVGVLPERRIHELVERQI